MKKIVIYDENGVIFSVLDEGNLKPKGIPFIETDIPKNNVLVSVNVETKEPVFQQSEKTQNELINEELDSVKMALAELAEILLGGL